MQQQGKIVNRDDCRAVASQRHFEIRSVKQCQRRATNVGRQSERPPASLQQVRFRVDEREVCGLAVDDRVWLKRARRDELEVVGRRLCRQGPGQLRCVGADPGLEFGERHAIEAYAHEVNRSSAASL